jgi:PAS domain S-box-containing protein
MVKILLIHDGGEQASWMQSHLSEYLQIELWSVSSIPDGEELYQNIFPDVVLLPLSLRTECDLESIVCWQRRCTTVHGSRPGFLFYVIHHNDLIFFDISQGSTLISLQTSDALKQVITLMRQVAGRSKVERSLREDYDHHNRIISTMPLASMEVQGGMIGWVNPAFLRLIGHDIHEIIGTPPSKWISSVQDVSGDQLSSSPVTMEGSIWAWGNEEIPCRITVHPTKSAVPGDGIWFIEDRREYASLLSLLKETEYRCQEQLYLAETMVIRLLPDGIISFANQAAARCFGYESDILIGNPVSVLFPAGAGIGENLAELFLEVSDESSSALHIIEHRKRDGKRLWVSWMSRGLYTPDNDLAGIILVGTDMTEMAADGRERISTRVWRDRILMETDIQPDVFDSVLQACMEIGREAGKVNRSVQHF